MESFNYFSSGVEKKGTNKIKNNDQVLCPYESPAIKNRYYSVVSVKVRLLINIIFLPEYSEPKSREDKALHMSPEENSFFFFFSPHFFVLLS